jgi:[protein-PII] uridylyltransferase
VALVAIGGYGRGELSLFSDVDLMVLHELDDPAELASAIFRPLWDAKLRVGHAVRTVKE